ncbi:MAG: hypothetical protein AB8B83_05335 [Bdellovibrionales bacterium]
MISPLKLLKPSDGSLLFDPRWDILAHDVNCLAYAMQVIDHGYAVPGMLQNDEPDYLPPSKFSSDVMIDLMVGDGFHATDQPKNGTIGLAMSYGDPTCDWDMAELDFCGSVFFNGQWFRKNTGMPIEHIESPEHSDAWGGGDGKFVCCFDIPPGGVLYRPRMALLQPDNDLIQALG